MLVVVSEHANSSEDAERSHAREERQSATTAAPHRPLTARRRPRLFFSQAVRLHAEGLSREVAIATTVNEVKRHLR
jgi:hypothetical protein